MIVFLADHPRDLASELVHHAFISEVGWIAFSTTQISDIIKTNRQSCACVLFKFYLMICINDNLLIWWCWTGWLWEIGMLFGRGTGETLGWGFHVSFIHHVNALSHTGALLWSREVGWSRSKRKETGSRRVTKSPTLLNGKGHNMPWSDRIE